MKKMNFTGNFCPSARMAQAEAAAEAASRRYAEGQACISKVAALKAAMDAKAAKKEAHRASLLPPVEREVLLRANSTVYMTVRAFNKAMLWKLAKPLVALAIKRENKEFSAALGAALWASIKSQMTSHSWEDNWEFGELKHHVGLLISELLDAAEETEAVEKHGFLWVVKFLRKNYRDNSDYRDLLRDLNFREKRK